jgi:hypothetical protein
LGNAGSPAEGRRLFIKKGLSLKHPSGRSITKRRRKNTGGKGRIDEEERRI